MHDPMLYSEEVRMKTWERGLLLVGVMRFTESKMLSRKSGEGVVREAVELVIERKIENY